ncbi:MAG: hypothetical protein ACOZCO_02950 [Bacteroidota bacterium]
MTKKILATSMLFISFNAMSESILTLEGQYQSKNLYVSNAVSSSGVGYCAYEVRVNGNITTDVVQSSAFEIDLSIYKFNPGDPVTIQIVHNEGCQPKVLNPMSIKPMPTFQVKEMNLSSEGLLTWSTTGESGSLPYNVEQFKWNKWVKIGEVQGAGTNGENKYDFKVTLTSGENKIRVTQKGNLNKVVSSNAVSAVSDIEKPTWEYNSKTGKIIFSKETSFEIFDKFGQARVRGFGKEINVSSLQDDEYYLCFDNVVENFKK